MRALRDAADQPMLGMRSAGLLPEVLCGNDGRIEGSECGMNDEKICPECKAPSPHHYSRCSKSTFKRVPIDPTTRLKKIVEMGKRCPSCATLRGIEAVTTAKLALEGIELKGLAEAMALRMEATEAADRAAIDELSKAGLGAVGTALMAQNSEALAAYRAKYPTPQKSK